jgi:shikimate 5-dehydrogenase
MSTTTRLYGIFVDSTGQRPMTVPALFNALFDRHGIDAIFVPFQVTAAHVAAAIAVALALAGVGALTITNRTQPETDALAHTVRRTAVVPAGFDIVINATSLGQQGTGRGPQACNHNRPDNTPRIILEGISQYRKCDEHDEGDPPHEFDPQFRLGCRGVPWGGIR